MDKTEDHVQLKSSNANAESPHFLSAHATLQPPALQLKAKEQNQEGHEVEQVAEQPYQLAAEYSGTSPAEDGSSGSDPVSFKPNNTGLPAQLKTGVESLSGFSLDDVKVHYNSDKPAQLQAHAYAQGTDIHVASGQERHLPHEAWHVVQQKQGRVQPTTQLKAFNINDDARLEKEADVMGAKANQNNLKTPSSKVSQQKSYRNTISETIQKVDFEEDSKTAVNEHKKGNTVTKGMESVKMSLVTGGFDLAGSTSMNLMKRLGKDKALNQNLADSGWNKTSDGYKDAVGANEKNGQLGNLGNATKVFNAAGTAGATLSLISNIAGAVESFKEGDFSDQLISLFDVSADGASLISGVAGMVADYIPGEGAKAEAGSVSGGAFFMEGVVKTAKGAYNSIKNIYEAVKVHIGGKEDEKFVQSDAREKGERTWEILSGLLDTGVGVVKMLKHAVSDKFGFLKDTNLKSTLGDSAGGNLMPVLGLVMGVVDIAQRVIQLIKSGIQKLRIRDKMVSLMAGDKTAAEKKEQIRDGKKKVLRTKRQKALEVEEKARELAGLDLGSYTGDSEDEKKSNKEAYDYLKEMDYINGKRQIRASIHIGLDLTSIGGEIANMTGLGATAGVALKAASSAGGIALPIFRKFKQWGRDKAAEHENEEGGNGEARGIFKLFDSSKNSDDKKSRIIKDVGFVFKHLSVLQGLDDGQLAEKVEPLKLYVEATGASFSMFLRSFGVKGQNMSRDTTGAAADVSGTQNDEGVKKAAIYLMECMKERE